MLDEFSGNAKDADAAGFQRVIAKPVAFGAKSVRCTVYFDIDAQGGDVKIEDISSEHILAANANS